MATTAFPTGFRPVAYKGGRPYNGAVREYRIRSGMATTIAVGDIVRIGGSADTSDEGYLLKETGTSSLTKPIGVFTGCSYTDPNTGQKVWKAYYPASTVASDIKATVADDPGLIFAVQASAAVAQAELGLNAALVQGSGPSSPMYTSTQAVNGGTATTNTLPFRIVDFINRPGSAVGDAFTDVLVCWNAGIHAYDVATGR